MTAPAFPLAGVVRTPDGLARADLRTLAERTCGCGAPATVALITATWQVRNGKMDRRTRRIPLCAAHDAANRAQRRRANEARWRAWR